jgi:hypothetical protein
MEKSFNCLLLRNTKEMIDFSVPIYKEKDEKGKDEKFTMFGNHKINLNILTAITLRNYICDKLKVANYGDMKLWKVDVDEDEIKDVSTDDDIEKKLKGRHMKPRNLFSEYFEAELDNKVKFTVSNIHIFAIIPPAGKCLPTFYLSNKKFAVIKYRFGLISFFLIILSYWTKTTRRSRYIFCH